MVWLDWKNWYEVVNRFMLEIIWILKNHNVLDRAQGRLRVIEFYAEAGEKIRVRQIIE